MFDKLNWPTALVAVGGMFGVVALVYTGHMTLPGGAGAALWGLVLACMERAFAKPEVKP